MFNVDYEGYLNTAILHLELGVPVSEADFKFILDKLYMVDSLVMALNTNDGYHKLRSTQMMSYIIISELEKMGYIVYMKSESGSKDE